MGRECAVSVDNQSLLQTLVSLDDGVKLFLEFERVYKTQSKHGTFISHVGPGKNFGLKQ